MSDLVGNPEDGFSHNQAQLVPTTFELCLEKTCFLHRCENKDKDHMPVTANYHAADQGLCFRYIDSTIPLLPESEISSILPSSVAV